jgi:sugar phosphate isomerase/epimerase
MDIDVTGIEHEKPSAARRVLETAGITVGACPLPIELRHDDRTFRAGLKCLDRVAALAAEVGVSVMYQPVPAASDAPVTKLMPILQRRWAACAEVLRRRDIGLAIEPLGSLYRRNEGKYEFIWRLEEACSFASSCGPGVGVLVDSWHWHLSGGTTQDIVDVGDHILHVHVADVPDAPPAMLRDDQRVLPGEGLVDFDGFFGSLTVIGYRGLISPEVPGTWSAGMSRYESARYGLEATQKALIRRSSISERSPSRRFVG